MSKAIKAEFWSADGWEPKRNVQATTKTRKVNVEGTELAMLRELNAELGKALGEARGDYERVFKDYGNAVAQIDKLVKNREYIKTLWKAMKEENRQLMVKVGELIALSETGKEEGKGIAQSVAPSEEMRMLRERCSELEGQLSFVSNNRSDRETALESEVDALYIRLSTLTEECEQNEAELNRLRTPKEQPADAALPDLKLLYSKVEMKALITNAIKRGDIDVEFCG